MRVAKHNIVLFGLAGLIFAVLATALILFSEGFVSTSWYVKDNRHDGLWQECISGGGGSENPAWLISSKVFASLGLVTVVFAFILATTYMTPSSARKNINIVCLTGISFIAGIFIIVTVSVYGVHSNAKGKLSWSYYVTLLSGIFCLLAGIVSVVQLRRSLYANN